MIDFKSYGLTDPPKEIDFDSYGLTDLPVTQKKIPEKSFLQNLGDAALNIPSTALHMGEGLLDSIREPLTQAANSPFFNPAAVILGDNQPGFKPLASGIGYDIGKFTGDVAPFGGVAKKGATEAARLLSKINGFNFIRPEKRTEALLSKLGKGKTVEQVSGELAGRLGAAGIENKAPIAKGYQGLESKFGQDIILPQKDLGGYGPIAPKVPIDVKTASLKELFTDKPNYSNARNYLSQLKADERDLRKAIKIGGPNASEMRNELKQVVRERHDLNHSLHSFLKESAPGASEELSALDKAYRKEVIPYTKWPTIRNIFQSMESRKGLVGSEIDLDRLLGIFKSPQSKASIQKIASDIGPEGIQNLLYMKLGKAKDAKSFIKTFKDLERSQWSSYITPQLTKEAESIEKAFRNKKIAKLSAYIGLPTVGIWEGRHYLGRSE